MTRIETGFGQANGTTLNTTNVPEAMQVTGGAGSTQTASNVHPYAGVNGVLFNAAAARNSIIRLPVTPNSDTASARAMYWYSGVAPSNEQTLLTLRLSTGMSCSANLIPAGKFRVHDPAGTDLFTTAVPATGYYRLELWETVSTGVVRFAYFLGDSLTPVESYTSPAGQVVGSGLLVSADLGRINTPATADLVYAHWFATDGGLGGFIGPVGGAVSGGAAAGGVTWAGAAVGPQTGAGGGSTREFGFDLPAGTALSTANVPNTSQVTTGGGSTATASAAHPHSGGTGALFAGAAGYLAIARLVLAATDQTMAVRGYLWYSGTPPTVGAEGFASLRHASGNSAKIALTTAGRIAYQDRLGANLWNSAPLGAAGLYRVECWQTSDSATTGVGHFAYYVGDSVTPAEAEFVTTAADFGTAAFAALDIGRINTNVEAVSFFLDDWAINDGLQGFIGPKPAGGSALTSTVADTVGIVDTSSPEIISIRYDLVDGVGVTDSFEDLEIVRHRPGGVTHRIARAGRHFGTRH